jgi:hypothetical protein
MNTKSTISSSFTIMGYSFHESTGTLEISRRRTGPIKIAFRKLNSILCALIGQPEVVPTSVAAGQKIVDVINHPA